MDVDAEVASTSEYLVCFQWKQESRDGHLYRVHGVARQGHREKVALPHKSFDAVKELSEGNFKSGNDAVVYGADLGRELFSFYGRDEGLPSSLTTSFHA